MFLLSVGTMPLLSPRSITGAFNVPCFLLLLHTLVIIHRFSRHKNEGIAHGHRALLLLCAVFSMYFVQETVVLFFTWSATD